MRRTLRSFVLALLPVGLVPAFVAGCNIPANLLSELVAPPKLPALPTLPSLPTLPPLPTAMPTPTPTSWGSNPDGPSKTEEGSNYGDDSSYEGDPGYGEYGAVNITLTSVGLNPPPGSDRNDDYLADISCFGASPGAAGDIELTDISLTSTYGEFQTSGMPYLSASINLPLGIYSCDISVYSALNQDVPLGGGSSSEIDLFSTAGTYVTIPLTSAPAPAAPSQTEDDSDLADYGCVDAFEIFAPDGSLQPTQNLNDDYRLEVVLSAGLWAATLGSTPVFVLGTPRAVLRTVTNAPPDGIASSLPSAAALVLPTGLEQSPWKGTWIGAFSAKANATTPNGGLPAGSYALTVQVPVYFAESNAWYEDGAWTVRHGALAGVCERTIDVTYAPPQGCSSPSSSDGGADARGQDSH